MANRFQRYEADSALNGMGYRYSDASGTYRYEPRTSTSSFGYVSRHADKSGGRQLLNLWRANEALQSRLSRGQQSSLTRIMKDVVGRGTGDPNAGWGSGPYAMNWAFHGQNEAMKVLLRGGNRNQAAAAAQNAFQMASAGSGQMPPTASKRYILRTSRASDEERYASSGGRGSNASSMRGLGLRNAASPAGGGGGSIARATSRTSSSGFSRRSGNVGLSGS